jgi:hypothetical protein
MLKKIVILAFAGLALASCEESGPDKVNYGLPLYQTDQVLRAKLFKECMGLLPEGPKKTTYNDWDEVVSACGSQAYYQSLSCAANCKSSEIKETSDAKVPAVDSNLHD